MSFFTKYSIFRHHGKKSPPGKLFLFLPGYRHNLDLEVGKYCFPSRVGMENRVRPNNRPNP
jgi:hypothetical protein